MLTAYSLHHYWERMTRFRQSSELIPVILSFASLAESSGCGPWRMTRVTDSNVSKRVVMTTTEVGLQGTMVMAMMTARET